MCGRFTLTATPAELAELLDLSDPGDFPPRYNVAPTQPILVVLGGRDERLDAASDRREARLVRWGLWPAWVKDPRDFPLLFNARAETAAEKNAFRAALTYRRCLVPASGFYEWRRDGNARKGQPYFIRPRAGGLIVFAGLFETWSSADGSEIDTAAILTTASNATLSAIHERMPVVIEPEAAARWLACRTHGPAAVADLLRPARDDLFEAVPVSERVNRVANIGPEVQARVTPEAMARPSASIEQPAPSQQAELF